MNQDDKPIFFDVDIDEKPSVSDQIDFRECIYWLLIGLEVREIEHFMARCTQSNCLKLGMALTKAFKDKLNEDRGIK